MGTKLSPEEFAARYGQEALSQFRVTKERPSFFQSTGEALKDIPSDIGEAVVGAGEQLKTGFGKVVEAREQVATGEITRSAGAVKAGGEAARGIVRAGGEAFLGLLKAPFSPKAEQKVGEKIQQTAADIIPKVKDRFFELLEEDKARGGQIEKNALFAESLLEKYKTDPTVKAYVDGTGGFIEAASELLGFKGTTKLTKEGLDIAGDALTQTYKRVGQIKVPDIKIGDPRSLFKTTPKNTDDVIQQISQSQSVSQTVDVKVNVPETKIDITSINKQLDELIEQGKTAEARALAEQVAPKLTVKEKWAGIRPDIKKRIEGKEELMREYFDIAHTRNVDDTVPTAFEYGGAHAQDAVIKMDNLLSETGGEIGAARTKYGTIKADINQINRIESTFRSELDKLNLELVGGQVRQKAGTITKLGAKNDINVLSDLAGELLVAKQSPTLTNLIDLRSAFDSKINFGKTAQEVSNSVDPLSRSVRKSIADEAASIVGTTEAAKLKKYSEFMDAYNDLKSYTDRRAGSEYMLRVMLSGRGGEARQISQTILEHTGVDLMDHATMMQIATELIGNDAQKNLFRQEVSKAGLDVARLVGGDPRGAAATLFQKGVDRVLDPEKIFLEAAQ